MTTMEVTFTDSLPDAIAREFPIGKAVSYSELPFVGRVVAVQLTSPPVVTFTPLTPAELAQFPLYAEFAAEYERHLAGEPADPYSVAQYIAALLNQESWLAGVPAAATIECAVCGVGRPAHGSNGYAEFTLCNRCVGQWEEDVLRDGADIAAWVALYAPIERAARFIQQIERDGHGYWPLADGRHLDIHALYVVQPARSYDSPPHWPSGYMPIWYQIFVRSGPPGEFFNVPALEIIATTRNRLSDILQGRVPIPQSSSVAPGRTLPGLAAQFDLEQARILQAAIAGQLHAWQDGGIWLSTEQALADALAAGVFASPPASGPAWLAALLGENSD